MKRLLHWSWRLFEAIVLLILLAVVFIQAGVFAFQQYPKQSSHFLQQQFGIQLNYQAAEIQQSWRGFDIQARGVQLQQNGVDFKAKSLGFDIDFLQLFSPSLFLGDHLTIKQAVLSLPFEKKQASLQSSYSLNDFLPQKLWQEMTISQFEVHTKLQHSALKSPVPIVLQLSQIQSRLGVSWLLNGQASIFLAADPIRPVTTLAFQGHFTPSLLGLISEGQFRWQFLQPLSLSRVQSLLADKQRSVMPTGRMSLDGELLLNRQKIERLNLLLSLQQLKWPGLKRDKVLPNSLAVEAKWQEGLQHQVVLENLRIDQRFVGHQNLAKLTWDNNQLKFQMSAFNSAPFEPIVKKALEVYFDQPLSNNQPLHLDIAAIQLGLDLKTLQPLALNLKVNQFSIPELPDLPGVQLSQMQLIQKRTHFTLVLGSPLVMRDRKIFESPISISLKRGVNFRYDLISQDLAIPSMAFKMNQIPMQLSWFSSGSQVRQAKLQAHPKTLAEVKPLLPYPLMSKTLQAWLKQSLVSGKNIQLVAEMAGNLKQFPFKKKVGGGFLKASADIEDATLKFQPDWPAVKHFNAHLSFTPDDLMITTPQATLHQLQAKAVSVAIEGLGHDDIAVDIQAKVKADASQAQRFLLATPLAKTMGIQSLLQKKVALKGKLAVDLKKIWIPINGFEHRQEDIQVGVDLNKVNIKLYQWLNFEAIQGRLNIHNKIVTAPNLVGELTGVPFSASVVTDQKQHQLRIKAKGALQAPENSPLMAGYVQWQQQTDIPFDNRPLKLKADLSFDKFHSRMPPPLGQSFFASGPAHIQYIRHNKTAEFRLNWGKQIKAKGILNNNFNHPIQKLALAVEEQSLPQDLSNLEGVQIKGTVQALDIDLWVKQWPDIQKILPLQRETQTTFPFHWSSSVLKIKKITFHQHDYLNTQIRWQTLSNDTISKEVFSLNNQDIVLQGVGTRQAWAVQANKIHIYLKPKIKPPFPKVPPSKYCQSTSPIKGFPKVTFSGKDIKWGSRQIETMRFKLLPAKKTLSIRDLRFHYKKAYGTGHYEWNYATNNSLLKLHILSKSVEDLTHMLDIEKGVRGKKAEVELDTQWTGGPLCFSIQRLKGKVYARLDDGVIKDVEPGIGRLLGLLSINSITRRLSLNLSDVTGEGLAYSVIESSGIFEGGELNLTKFRLDAPAVKAKLWGKVNLVDEAFNLKADVTPAVGSSVATIATLVGAVNPLTAILTYTLLKNIPEINEDLVTYRYTITGSWKSPVFKQKNSGVQLITE